MLGRNKRAGGCKGLYPSGVVTNSQPEGVCQSLRLHGFVPHPRLREGRNNAQRFALKHTLMKTLNHVLVLYKAHSESAGGIVFTPNIAKFCNGKFICEL